MSRIWFDKWVHVGIFFGLAIVYGWSFPASKFRWPVFILSAFVYGLLVEFAQDSLIPNRSFDLGDWVADCAGTLAGVAVFRWYQKK